MSVYTGCGSDRTVRNGSIHHGKQRCLCRACHCRFVENPQQQPISDATRGVIDRLLGERIPLAGISRVTGVSETWLQEYVNARDANTPREVDPEAAPKRGLVGSS
jgi:transposase-like protein